MEVPPDCTVQADHNRNRLEIAGRRPAVRKLQQLFGATRSTQNSIGSWSNVLLLLRNKMGEAWGRSSALTRKFAPAKAVLNQQSLSMWG